MAATAEGSSAKRDAIVRAATSLFSRYGFRKTSVDLIAKEAGVAKPTVYAHFEDKEAVLVAVCAAVCERILHDARAARAQDEVAARLTAMLAAKFTTLFGLIDSSPHAHELLDSTHHAAQQIIHGTDGAFVELLQTELRACARTKQLDVTALGGVPALARLLMQAGHGASFAAKNVTEHEAQLHAMVRAIVRAGLPPRR